MERRQGAKERLLSALAGVAGSCASHAAVDFLLLTALPPPQPHCAQLHLLKERPETSKPS